MDRFCIGLKGAYAGSQLSRPYTMTHVPGSEATTVDVHNPSPHGDGEGATFAASPPTPVPSKPSTPLTKGLSWSLQEQSSKVCYGLLGASCFLFFLP